MLLAEKRAKKHGLDQAIVEKHEKRNALDPFFSPKTFKSRNRFKKTFGLRARRTLVTHQFQYLTVPSASGSTSI